MKKQSFLERLTGTRTISGEPGESGEDVGEAGENIPATKAWSSAVYAEETEEYPREDAPEDESDNEAGLAIDMYEHENELIIQAMIAGVTPENLSISIARDQVSIKGVRVAPREIPDEDHHARELYWGAFARAIALPFEIDTENSEAVEKYGLLIIRLPKLDSNRTQELKVKSI